MSVLIQNTSGMVEHVDIVDLKKNIDTVTVQPGGRVTLPRGWNVKVVGYNRPHLKITGDDKPVSSLQSME